MCPASPRRRTAAGPETTRITTSKNGHYSRPTTAKTLWRKWRSNAACLCSPCQISFRSSGKPTCLSTRAVWQSIWTSAQARWSWAKSSARSSPTRPSCFPDYKTPTASSSLPAGCPPKPATTLPLSARRRSKSCWAATTLTTFSGCWKSGRSWARPAPRNTTPSRPLCATTGASVGCFSSTVPIVPADGPDVWCRFRICRAPTRSRWNLPVSWSRAVSSTRCGRSTALRMIRCHSLSAPRLWLPPATS